jgi:hypothetical protein
MVRLITGEQECNNQSLTRGLAERLDKTAHLAVRLVGCF